MPWKMIGYILIALILILFIAFNLHNTSDVSLIFFTIEAVPVFFTVFISMIIGSLLTIPLSFLFRRSPREKKEKKQEDSLADIQAMLEPSADREEQEDKQKKRPRGRKRRKEKDPSTESVSDLDIR